MPRRKKQLEYPDEYWVDWSLRSGLAGWRVGPMHWQVAPGKMACGKLLVGGQVRSLHGVRALDPHPVCGIHCCRKCLRRWQKRVAQLLLERRQCDKAREAEQWERRNQPQIGYLKLW